VTKAKQPSLFQGAAHIPLAEKLRPQSFAEVVGQEIVLDEQGVLGRMVKTGHYHSMILWGPPGCGKTTIARLVAQHSLYHLETLSAVQSGVADLKKVFERAQDRLQDGRRTILFVDEIHRFNRAQQDAFLPVVENGTILLIGATTENPSFELNAALLSRCQVVVLARLSHEALQQLLQQAEAHSGAKLPLDSDARSALIAMADGDGRALLNQVELIMDAAPTVPLDTQALLRLVQKRAPIYDKHQESHYNLISALHKSLRGSDVDAALYWCARMLAGGEDPLYITRRLVRFAVEDIGMADPQALLQALAAKEAYDFLGSPEGELAIAQAVVYLGTAPKSNAQYRAFGAAQRSAAQFGSLMPPMHILNAPTKLMKELGYSKGYAYDHDAADGFSGQNYFPEDMEREHYYKPVSRGFEREIQKRLEYWAKLREQKAEEHL
jgi:putative ATPase